MLTKKDLEHLAELARIDLKVGEEKKLQKDLGNILDYFKELQGVNTEGVEPTRPTEWLGHSVVVAGGTELKSVVREDVLGGTDDTGKGPEQFPDKQGGFLKVPPVF